MSFREKWHRISPTFRPCNDCKELTPWKLWIHKQTIINYIPEDISTILVRKYLEWRRKALPIPICPDCLTARVKKGGLL